MGDHGCGVLVELPPEGFRCGGKGGDRGLGGLEFVLQERAFLGLLGQALTVLNT
jgi:hypothetical protein